MSKMRPCEYHRIFSSIQPEIINSSSTEPNTETDALDDYIAEHSDIMEKMYVNDTPFIKLKSGLAYGQDIYVCDLRNNLRSVVESSVVFSQKKYKLPEYLKKLGYQYGTDVPELQNTEPVEESTYKNINYKSIPSSSPEFKKYLKKYNIVKDPDKVSKEYNGDILIDTKEDKLIGRVLIGNKKDEGFITDLVVGKKYRELGFGSMLLDSAINKYNGVDLTVNKDNSIAVNMYKNHGFTVDDSLNAGDGMYYMRLKSHNDKSINESYIEEPTTEGKVVKVGKIKYKPMSVKQLQHAGERLMNHKDVNVARFGESLKESADEEFSNVMKYLSNVNILLFIGGESLSTCMPYIISSILVIKQDNPEMKVIPELKKQRSIIKSKLKPKDDNLRLYTEFLNQVIKGELKYVNESVELDSEMFILIESDDMDDMDDDDDKDDKDDDHDDKEEDEDDDKDDDKEDEDEEDDDDKDNEDDDDDDEPITEADNNQNNNTDDNEEDDNKDTDQKKQEQKPKQRKPRRYNERFGKTNGPTDYDKMAGDEEEKDNEEEPNEVKDEDPKNDTETNQENNEEEDGPTEYNGEVDDGEPQEDDTQNNNQDNTPEDITPPEDNNEDTNNDEPTNTRYNEDFGDDGPTDYTDQAEEDEPEEPEPEPTQTNNNTDNNPTPEDSTNDQNQQNQEPQQDQNDQQDQPQNNEANNQPEEQTNNDPNMQVEPAPENETEQNTGDTNTDTGENNQDTQNDENNNPDSNEESQQDDNGLDDGPTDYDSAAGADATGTEDTDGGDTGEEGGDTAQDGAEDPNTETPPAEGNEEDKDTAVKNYNIRLKFKKLAESISDILTNLSSIIYHNPIQNQVLERGIDNIQTIKEQIISYMEFNLSSDYKTNLYYYTTFIQALQLNLDMLTKNSKMSIEDTKNKNNK